VQGSGKFGGGEFSFAAYAFGFFSQDPIALINQLRRPVA
jgi:hypothetical protein